MMYRSTGPCLENPITCGFIMELPFWNGFTNPSTIVVVSRCCDYDYSHGFWSLGVPDLTSSGQVSEGVAGLVTKMLSMHSLTSGNAKWRPEP